MTRLPMRRVVNVLALISMRQQSAKNRLPIMRVFFFPKMSDTVPDGTSRKTATSLDSPSISPIAGIVMKRPK